MSYKEFIWNGKLRKISKSSSINDKLLDLELPLFVLKNYKNLVVGVAEDGIITSEELETTKLICSGIIPKLLPEDLGSSRFLHRFGLKYAYVAGAMYNAISSKEMIIELAKNGYLGIYGTKDVEFDQIENDIVKIKSIIPERIFGCNIVHNVIEEQFEMKLIKMLLKYKINILEVSSFVNITLPLAYYRIVGIKERIEGGFVIGNKIMVKVSRVEIAKNFLKPAPEKIIRELINMSLINERQAKIAKEIPMADAITLEDNENNITQSFSYLVDQRDELYKNSNTKYDVFLGLTGGIGSPVIALNMFNNGADYIVTGTINQCTVESGISDKAKNSLSSCDISDVISLHFNGDFNINKKINVLKKGTLFPMRVNKLYNIYNKYKNLKNVDSSDIDKIESQIFKKSIREILNEVEIYFKKNDPNQLNNDRLYLLIKWYLIISAKLSLEGTSNRELDYQILCSNAMGIFNYWVKGSYLENHQNRYVADIAEHMLKGTAYLQRLKLFNYFGGDEKFNYKLNNN
ncbi:MAG: hypothetical protein ABF289_17730 [Clostridiales bacterium]